MDSFPMDKENMRMLYYTCTFPGFGGKKITNDMVALYNKKIITEAEIDKLVENNMLEDDGRVLTLSEAKFNKIFKGIF